MAPKNTFSSREDVVPEIEWAPHEVETKVDPIKAKIVWRNVFLFSILHFASVYGLLLIPDCKLQTWIFSYIFYVIGALSITAGAHRLWSHRSFKAKLPLRIMLMIFNCTAGQNHIIEWCRDHRVHHKYSETSADPHDATRGFFFSHIGWLLCKKHPNVITKGKTLDFTDLYADPVLTFQKKYYMPLAIFGTFILPTIVPWLLWEESLWNSYFVAGALRYCLILNATWLVNSIAHMWGMRPYDKNISPAENIFVAVGAIGEGFHNYHHTFPHDYATSEYGMQINLTTMFINLMAKIGWAYDLRKVSQEVIEARKRRTGCLSGTERTSSDSSHLDHSD